MGSQNLSHGNRPRANDSDYPAVTTILTLMFPSEAQVLYYSITDEWRCSSRYILCSVVGTLRHSTLISLYLFVSKFDWYVYFLLLLHIQMLSASL